MSRGNDLTDLHRNRHHTDDSSIGSYKYEVNFGSYLSVLVHLPCFHRKIIFYAFQLMILPGYGEH